MACALGLNFEEELAAIARRFPPRAPPPPPPPSGPPTTLQAVNPAASTSSLSASFRDAHGQLPRSPVNIYSADVTHQRLTEQSLTMFNAAPYDPDSLQSINANHNELTSLRYLPWLRNAHTVQIAHNRFQDSGDVVRELKNKCPQLRHLTLMPNPCCPANMSPDLHASYRAYVVSQLPTLDVLDCLQVTANDRQQAQRFLQPQQRPAAPPPPPQPTNQAPQWQQGGYGSAAPAAPLYGSYYGGPGYGQQPSRGYGSTYPQNPAYSNPQYGARY
jgi:hypothetical protein